MRPRVRKIGQEVRLRNDFQPVGKTGPRRRKWLMEHTEHAEKSAYEAFEKMKVPV
jgi:hypothetical protein